MVFTLKSKNNQPTPSLFLSTKKKSPHLLPVSLPHKTPMAVQCANFNLYPVYQLAIDLPAPSRTWTDLKKMVVRAMCEKDPGTYDRKRRDICTSHKRFFGFLEQLTPRPLEEKKYGRSKISGENLVAIWKERTTGGVLCRREREKNIRNSCPCNL